ncbi:predicted protein [Pyrenophora tritici-repentis Pt-1C-BFP]|uniref:Uncharacterized protein n=1 Tax=Pyrenophora tritici-repentis (strain Pt-1C-BFP) TaxID=426418 RepID=B2W402_PYRTR|nr:uncharacterized protein PTRG_05202 [Pyrenophora tritici-repentis Pt-1C-BFP]EDU48109.1 predicted protein [Pyrenophora tritici-repentis Pt-1C-BFP]
MRLLLRQVRESFPALRDLDQKLLRKSSTGFHRRTNVYKCGAKDYPVECQ